MNNRTLILLVPLLTLYGLFYIGFEVLPEGWSTATSQLWWSFPMLLTFGLILFASVCFCIEVLTHKRK